MAEADTDFLKSIQIDKPFRLLGFENAEEGFDELDQEVSGLLGRPSEEVRDYLNQRTEHIDDKKDRKMAKDLLELRMRTLGTRQQA